MNEKLLMNEPEHQDVLKEEFGKDFAWTTSAGSAQLPPWTKQMSELQLVDTLKIMTVM